MRPLLICMAPYGFCSRMWQYDRLVLATDPGEHVKFDGLNTMVASPISKRTSIATGCALALITAAFGDQAHAESNLDASYTISFARIRVGEITASVIFGPTEYTMSASGRAGGLMKALMDGEGSFTARGPITDDHPVPTNFTSKIVANGQTSDVTMVLDEGSVKELAATAAAFAREQFLTQLSK